MNWHGPKRLIVVSSLGSTVRTRGQPSFARCWRVKATSDAHVQASGLDYTIVRPGGRTNEPGSGLV